MERRLPRRAASIIPLALIACWTSVPSRAAPLLRGRVRVSGNAAVAADRMGLSTAPARGEPFPDGLIEEDKHRIEEAYAREGYLRARVTPRAWTDPRTGLTDVTYDVVEGIVIYVEQAAVDGIADRARRAQAQRLITLRAGDRFDSAKARESRRNILRLAWVKDVDINIESAKEPNKVYVDFDVTESTPAAAAPR